MSLTVVYQKQFKKDFKLMVKRGLDQSKLAEIIELLMNQGDIPIRYRDHNLVDSKSYYDARELHIQPDWLLIYKIDIIQQRLILIRTGSHSDLFMK